MASGPADELLRAGKGGRKGLRAKAFFDSEPVLKVLVEGTQRDGAEAEEQAP